MEMECGSTALNMCLPVIRRRTESISLRLARKPPWTSLLHFGSELKEFHIQPMDESGGDGEDSR